MKKNILLDAETDWAQGNELKLKASNSDSANALLTHFLRQYRGLAQQNLLSSPQTNEEHLELIRCKIRQGQWQEAQQIIDQVLPHFANQTAICLEFHIEQLRLQIIRKEYISAIEDSAKIISNPLLMPLSKMTVQQLRADAYFQLHQYDNAIDCLESVSALIKQFPLASSALSSLAFLSLLYAETNQIEKMQTTINKMDRFIKGLEQTELLADRLLTFSRTMLRIYIKTNNKKLAELYWQNSYILAKTLGDHATIAKCHEDKNLDLLINMPEQNNPSLLWFPDLKSVFTLQPMQFINLDTKNILVQIVNLIFDKPMTSAEIFEQIWNITYIKDVHDNLLRVHFSNLRKLLPKDTLKNTNGKWSIN